MKIGNEETLNINGQEYWTVRQFSILTKLSEARIRSLIYIGNSIRKLKSFYIGSNKPLIPARELFDFTFIQAGRPLEKSKFLSTEFYLDNDRNLKSQDTYVTIK